jgi:F-type H+-transporting ATPase subunit gamma
MNLRQLKSKIKSIQNVGQITKAMQLVSAVKMKKAQQKAISGKPYREALEETIVNLLKSTVISESSLTSASNEKSKKLAIVISSNKGLCGVFNFNLFRYINKKIEKIDDYEFIVLGNKAVQFLYHIGGSIIADFSQNSFEESVSAVYKLASERFLNGPNSSVSLFYNRFVSSLVSKSTEKLLLPLDKEIFEESIKKEGQSDDRGNEYVVEPSANKVINGLFNFYLESEIRGAIQESQAAEHSARMVAMKSATDNSNDLVEQLTLMRNSIRQEKITNELLDMNTARLAVS